MKIKESNSRSLSKAFSWRVLGSLATGSIVFLFTKNAGGAVAVGAVEFVFKIFLYFIHERIWDCVPFGRNAKFERREVLVEVDTSEQHAYQNVAQVSEL